MRRGELKIDQLAGCPGLKIPAQVVFYQARAGTVGSDHLARQLRENLVEHAKTVPAYEPIVDRLVRTVVARSIAPAQSIPDDEDDPADYPPVINPGNAVRQREKWFDPAHLRLREQKQIIHGAPPCAATESTDHLICKIFNGPEPRYSVESYLQ